MTLRTACRATDLARFPIDSKSFQLRKKGFEPRVVIELRQEWTQTPAYFVVLYVKETKSKGPNLAQWTKEWRYTKGPKSETVKGTVTAGRTFTFPKNLDDVDNINPNLTAAALNIVREKTGDGGSYLVKGIKYLDGNTTHTVFAEHLHLNLPESGSVSNPKVSSSRPQKSALLPRS